MLHWDDLTDDEIAEAPPIVRDLIERLSARTEATVRTMVLARPGLTYEQAQETVVDSCMRWFRAHVDADTVHRLHVYLTAAEVLREHVADGSVVRTVQPDGLVVYRHPDELE